VSRKQEKAIFDPAPLTIETVVLFTHPPSAGPTEKLAWSRPSNSTKYGTGASLFAFQERQ